MGQGNIGIIVVTLAAYSKCLTNSRPSIGENNDEEDDDGGGDNGDDDGDGGDSALGAWGGEREGSSSV